MTFKEMGQLLSATICRPSYREYLLDKYGISLGYNPEHWVRIIYSKEWRELLASLPLSSFSALEISPAARPILEAHRVKNYRAVNFPEFDIISDTLPEKFDLIIAEHVFEHLRHPYRAAHNVYEMLKDDGLFLIVTPFMAKIHGHPHDYTRWTPDGLEAFLEDCGFTAEVHAWGNRKAIQGNFADWRRYGWKRDLRNEEEFPACVWAYARKRDLGGNTRHHAA